VADEVGKTVDADVEGEGELRPHGQHDGAEQETEHLRGEIVFPAPQ
jgi:hypothetical protein